MTLRIRVVGGRNMATKSGLAGMFESKSNPFVVFVINGEEKKLPVATNVSLKEFSWGMDATCDFSWAPTDSEVKLHVKDKDTHKERYIAGAKMAMGSFLVDVGSVPITRTVELEYSDEKLKTKKGKGQLVLELQKIVPQEASTQQNGVDATQITKQPEQVNLSTSPPNYDPNIKRRLIVRAIGGSNLAPKTGLEHMMDAEPDPYLVIQIGGVTKKYPELDNVKTKDFQWGTDAVHEFEVNGDKVDILVHCKDKDLVVDHYIGGSKLTLKELCARLSNEPWEQEIELEYASPEMKTKAKASRGKIKLAFTLEDFSNPNKAESKRTDESMRHNFESHMKSDGEKRISEPKKDSMPDASVDNGTMESVQIDKVDSNNELSTATDTMPILSSTPTVSEQIKENEGTANEGNRSEEAMYEATDSKNAKSEPKQVHNLVESTTMPKEPEELYSKSDANKSSTEPTKSTYNPHSKRRLIVRAVGGSNLAPKTGLEHMMDAEPDPYLVIQIGGVTKKYPELDNVKTKDFQWGTDAVHEFEVNGDKVDILVHCKDKDLVVDHYIGGSKLTLKELCARLSNEPWEQEIELEYASPEMKTKAKASRGKIKLAFTLEDFSNPNKAKPSKSSIASVESKTNATPQQPVIQKTSEATTDKSQSVKSIPRENIIPGKEFKRHLKVQAISAANLAPKTGLEHMIDANPDPFLVIQVGKLLKTFPGLEDVREKDFKWSPHAIQFYEIDPTDREIALLVHCKDKDLIMDHYIGGAKFTLQMELLKDLKPIQQTIQLTYSDARLTASSEKSRGEIVLAFSIEDEPVANPVPQLFPSARLPSPRKATLSSRIYKGSLLLVAHSAKGLPLPTRKKGVPDKRADPFVVFQLGTERVEGKEAKDGHTSPVWQDCKNTFAIDTSVHLFVDVLIYDKKTSGFMAATRLRLMDCLSTLTNHIQATSVVKLDFSQNLEPCSDAGELQLSLMFSPTDTNEVAWKGAAIGELQIQALSIGNNIDLLGVNKDLYMDISIRRHGSSLEGYLSCCTSVKVDGSKPSTTRITWESESFTLPYGLLLHPSMTRDRCPVVVFEVKDKNAIIQEKPLVQNNISILDILGLNGKKQLALRHSRLPARIPLEFTVASSVPIPPHAMSFASTPGTLRVFILGAVDLGSMLTWQKVKATVSGKTWGRGDCVTEEIDAVDAIVAWNSSFEVQHLPQHVKYANDYLLTVQVSVNGKAVGNAELAVLDCLKQFSSKEFLVDIKQDNTAVCRVSLALQFQSAAPREDIISPRTSCIDFGPGHLHLVIFKAENLVPDNDVSVTEIDPEVRVQLKPKTSKQKDVKSTAKTKPLEDTGPDPVWNEYLRVDYMPNIESTTQISPMLHLSVNDIQMPGEVRAMNVIGTAEIPLASFVSTTEPCQVFSTKLTLERNGGVTGHLYICGIYESRTATEAVRRACQTQGQKLRLSTPNMPSSFKDSNVFPGRIEIHVAHAKDLNCNPLIPYRCEVCLSSNVDERLGLSSRTIMDPAKPEIVWDSQLTLFTETAKADFLRVDIFQEHNLVGWLKIPLSTYSQEPQKSFREYHDVVLTAKEKVAIKPRILLDITFHHDQSLQVFEQQCTSEEGYLYAALDALESMTPALINKKLSVRLTLIDGNTMDDKNAAIFPFQHLQTAKTNWNNVVVSLMCPKDITKVAYTGGKCAVLRYELLDGSTAYGKDAISRDEISIQSLLFTPNAVLSKRLPNSTIIQSAKNPISFIKLQAVFIPGPKRADIQNLMETFTTRISPIRGNLSIRAISARNLKEVDQYGEQDPYVEFQLKPTTYELAKGTMIQAQSGVCLNSGRHPLWNSPVYSLTVHDTNIEHLVIRVLDSGEEEHVPDTLIGSCQVSVHSLVKLCEDSKRWSEGWFKLQESSEPAGDLRLEYRFVAEETTRLCTEPPTKYIQCQGGKGTLMAKIISASNLPCISGMIPAVRIFAEQTNFSHVSQAEKRKIIHPQWNEQVQFDITWTPEQDTANLVRFEVVDMGAGVSKNLPVIAHCTVNVAPFVIHPQEIHKGLYPLMSFGMERSESQLEEPAIALEFQFIPISCPPEPFEMLPLESGQIHVKIVEGVIRTCTAYRPRILCTLNHLSYSQEKQSKPFISPLDEYAVCSWNEALLFDFTDSQEIANYLPSLDIKLFNEGDASQALGELLQIPLCPFVLFKGHINVVWYPIYRQKQFVAQIKLEIQFLKISPIPKAPLNDVLSIEIVEAKELRCAQDDSDDPQDPYVEMEFLSQTFHTKPHIDGGTTPIWHETFELPLLGLQPDILPVLNFRVLNADAKKHGNGLIGNCKWIVPKEVLYEGKLRDIILKLVGSSDGIDVRRDSFNGMLQIRIKRGLMKPMIFGDVDVLHMQTGEETKETPNLAGVLYVFGRENTNVRAALSPSKVTPITWASFNLNDMAILSVPWEEQRRHAAHRETKLTIHLDKKDQYIIVPEEELRTVFNSPRMEFRHDYTLCANDKTTKGVIDLSLVYIKPTQGLFLITITKVVNAPVVRSSTYCMEMRVLRNSPWVKCPSVRPKDNQLEWKPYSPRELQYTNHQEHEPPQIQLVLFSQEKGSDTWTKVAYTQVNLVQYIVSSKPFEDEEIPLTCVGTSEPSIVQFTIVFNPIQSTTAPHEATPEESTAAALKLAEGTAEMKKSFGLMGGDESTPVDIASLKEFAQKNETCSHMLQKAADLVGSLDALFDAMDSNKDGKISWEEYLERMQIIHALADEATTKPAKVIPKNQDPVDQLSDDEVEEVTDSEEEEKEEEETPATISYQSWKQPIQSRSYLDELDDEEEIQTKPLSPQLAKQLQTQANPAIAPMVALSKPAITTQPPGEVPKCTSNPLVAPRQGPNEGQIAKWKVADVIAWLEIDMELPDYAEAFTRASVDGSLLLSLTQEDLESHLYIQQPLHLRKLVTKIKQLQVKYGVVELKPSLPSEVSAPSYLEQLVGPKEVLSKYHTKAPVDLVERGKHEMERSKLQIRAQAKKAVQKKEQHIVDRAAKAWTFEYTGEPRPTTNKTSIEKVADIMKKDSKTSAFEGAMEEVMTHIKPQKIQIPLITNTDEVIEIVKQAIWKHGRNLAERTAIDRQAEHEAGSDFGSDEDEAIADASHRESLVELVYREFCTLRNNGACWLTENVKLSRLKFQGGLQAILGITMSWHQFDLLFRRLDAANEGEISWKTFLVAFGDPTPGKMINNDMLAVQEGLVLMVERLEEHELTLTQAWQAFDRDNSGAISVSEFSTLMKFLTHREGCDNLTKHQIFLMMAALDSSCDRLIQQSEFMKFIFIVWSHQLMQLQGYLARHGEDENAQENVEHIIARKITLRKALRKNFSRPFRDAMRCTPVAIPGPFQGLLEKFNLLPPTDGSNIQIWQVLKGESVQRDEKFIPKSTFSKKQHVNGKNTLALTKLKRNIQPERDHCTLRAATQVQLDADQNLIYDMKTNKLSQSSHRVTKKSIR